MERGGGTTTQEIHIFAIISDYVPYVFLAFFQSHAQLFCSRMVTNTSIVQRCCRGSKTYLIRSLDHRKRQVVHQSVERLDQCISISMGASDGKITASIIIYRYILFNFVSRLQLVRLSCSPDALFLYFNEQNVPQNFDEKGQVFELTKIRLLRRRKKSWPNPVAYGKMW